jgi:hypothetical protein
VTAPDATATTDLLGKTPADRTARLERIEEHLAQIEERLSQIDQIAKRARNLVLAELAILHDAGTVTS